jgi:hypothetical protein
MAGQVIVIIAQPFKAGVLAHGHHPKSRPGRKVLADGHHIFLPSLPGLMVAVRQHPTAKAVGYFQPVGATRN